MARLIAVIGLVCVGCSKPSGQDQGRVLYGNCETCHGAAGEGNEDYLAPAIAGLPEWYLVAQLEKFRDRIRGAHPDDNGGLRMGPIVQLLDQDDEVTSVAAYVAGLPPVNVVPALVGGSAERGATHFATCVQCHGEQAEGNEEKGAPPLRGASDWYLLRQIQHFKDGVRGADPRDSRGNEMRPMVVALGDEQAMKDVIAYIGSLGGR